MQWLYPVVKIKVGCVSLVALVKKDDQGNYIELGYAVFCGNTFVGKFADLTDALNCLEAEVTSVYPNPTERLSVFFIDASGTYHECAILAEAKQHLLEELALLNLSNLPPLAASEDEITQAYLGTNIGPTPDPDGPKYPLPQP